MPTAKKHAPLFQTAFLFMLVLAFSGFLPHAVAVEASGPTLANDQVAYHWAPAQQGGGLIGIEDRRRWCLVFNLKLLAVIGRRLKSVPVDTGSVEIADRPVEVNGLVCTLCSVLGVYREFKGSSRIGRLIENGKNGPLVDDLLSRWYDRIRMV